MSPLRSCCFGEKRRSIWPRNERIHPGCKGGSEHFLAELRHGRHHARRRPRLRGHARIRIFQPRIARTRLSNAGRGCAATLRRKLSDFGRMSRIFPQSLFRPYYSIKLLLWPRCDEDKRVTISIHFHRVIVTISVFYCTTPKSITGEKVVRERTNAVNE